MKNVEGSRIDPANINDLDRKDDLDFGHRLNMKNRLFIYAGIAVLIAFSMMSVTAQTTEFTYQGHLQNLTLAANGNHDFEFRLFNAATGGAQVSPTLTVNGVAVENGIFKVNLDFGPQFTGEDRFLEIRVRPTGVGDLVLLTPRQRIASAPYAVRSLVAGNAQNASQLGGIAANQYVITTDPRLADERPPTPGSANYIQNTASPQPGSEFNISGNGTVGGTLSGNTVNAATQFNISGDRVLSVAGLGNSFVGVAAGTNNTGTFNTFFGRSAGQANTTASSNTFFGSSAGNANTTASDNSFFGRSAGLVNTTGADNSFFGRSAGQANTTASSNSFFGSSAGQSNTTGSDNSFFGRDAGQANTTGATNSFFGRDAGVSNTTGQGNAFFGYLAGANNTSGLFNAFFGRSTGSANIDGADNAFFGYVAGSSNTTGDGNSFFGRSAGFSTTGNINSFFGRQAGSSNTTGSNNSAFGAAADVGSGNLSFATAIGAATVVSTSNTIALGRANGNDTVRIPGDVVVTGASSFNGNLAVAGGASAVFTGAVVISGISGGGATTLCRNATNFLTTCSSSFRYKSNVRTFGSGLNLIEKLRPITFDWKDGGMHDLGLGAEDVAAIEPLLVTYNEKGEVEGVKYDRIGVVLINAVREQQQIIERQQAEINELKRLKAVVCELVPSAAVCVKE